MRKLTIKMKVTLWYTLFMSLLAVLILLSLLSFSSSRAFTSMQNQLREAVLESISSIEWEEEKQKLEIDDDLDSFDDGIYLCVFDSEGYLLYGMIPKGFPKDFSLSPKNAEQVQSVTSDEGVHWSVYDSNVKIESYGNVWIRGIYSQTKTEGIFSMILRFSAVMLPLMVLFIALGGYYITKRAFLPIRRITQTASDISSGQDLSLRIQLGEGKDEVYQLAATFDNMLERIERQFEKEKQFTSDVSHELRTPVSVILSQCEYALSSSEVGAEEREHLEVIHNQSQKMARLISQLLSLSRADNGKSPLQMERINVSELFDIIVQEQQDNASQRNIALTSDIAPDIYMLADETMMMRFFINLITNAITYGKESGHIQVSLLKEGSDFKGCIKDDGIGISHEDLEKIWNRFYQADPSRTADRDGGFGLGLPMVKWIASAHNGQVWVESTLGKGSTFFFSFPSEK